VAGEDRPERIGAHPPLVVGGHDPHGIGAEAEEANRPVDRAVAVLADDDGDRRRAVQAGSLDVPAGCGEDVVAGRREAGPVGHLGARREADAGAAWQVEELEQPLPDDALHGAGRR
jgi:hypothetical protein